MKQLTLLIVASFAFLTGLSAQITREESDSIVLERLNREKLSYILYAKEGVQAEMTINTLKGEELELDYPCWIYYLQRWFRPDVQYAIEQDCCLRHYLVVNATNGNLLEVKTRDGAGPDNLSTWRTVKMISNEEFCPAVNMDNIYKTIPVINEFLETLPDDLNDTKKLQALTTWLKSHSCIIDATILCVSCIETLPEQSEIIVSFVEEGRTEKLILDVSMSSPLKATRYHEFHDTPDNRLRGIWIEKESLVLKYIDFYANSVAKFVNRMKNIENIDEFNYELQNNNKMSIRFLSGKGSVHDHDLTFVDDETLRIGGLTVIPENPDITYYKCEQLTTGHNDTVTLGYRHVYYDTQKDFRLQIDSVNEDSRCPINAYCVWEGNVEVHLDLIYGGSSRTKFTLNLNPKFQTDTIINNIHFMLISVTPHPGELERVIEQKDYEIKILVSPVKGSGQMDDFISDYYDDAKQLYFNEIINNTDHPNYNNPELDKTEINKILEIIQAVYHSASLERDTVFDIHKIHNNCYNLKYNSVSLMVNTELPAIQNLSRGIIPTGDNKLDSVLAAYAFDSVSAYYTYPDFPWLTVFTKNEYNMIPVEKELSMLESVQIAEFNKYCTGDGNRIQLIRGKDSDTVIFSIGRGDCPSGCIYRRYWEFNVSGGVAAFIRSYDNRDPDPEPISGNKVLMLTVDYTTNTFKGGKEFEFPENARTFTIAKDYKSPGDFGSLKLFYEEINEPLFFGTIIWMGSGEMIFPADLLPASRFPIAGTMDLRFPENGFEDILADIQGQRFTSDEYKSAWEAVQDLEAAREYMTSNPGQTVKMFLYTPSVGGGNPKEWYWVIYLKK
jgi:hypothetical protein